MDESLKDILSRHWNVLVRYINPTSSLISVLVEDKVLPSAMIEDIKKGNTRREKNEILLKSMKLRGNISYRKFREAMLKCGQVFIADLLYEEEVIGSMVDENDLTSVPSLKLSLSNEELKHLAHSLDARIRCKFLQNEWRKDSSGRLDLLKQRAEEYKLEKDHQSHAAESDQKVKQLSAELNVKNDIIRSLSLDINIMNQEVLNFTKKHQLKSGMPPSPGPGVPSAALGNDNSNMQSKSGRFRFFDKALAVINERLAGILGEPITDSEEEGVAALEARIIKLQEMMWEFQCKVSLLQKDREDALAILFPDKKSTGVVNLVQGVQRFLTQEQKSRYSLLTDVDKLSRKMRGIKPGNPTTGLHGLKQSAVTGKPKPEMVDYRFLSNHVNLLQADAEHMQKKLDWKDDEIRHLQAELATLRKRYKCQREQSKSPTYEPKCD